MTCLIYVMAFEKSENSFDILDNVHFDSIFILNYAQTNIKYNSLFLMFDWKNFQ